MKSSNNIQLALLNSAWIALGMLGISVAQAQQARSDVLRITPPGGPSITFIIAETVAIPPGEPGAVFNPIPGLDPFSMDIPFLLGAGAHFVLLTEPLGTIPEPGEVAIPIPCPLVGQQCILSDIVVGLLDTSGLAHVGFYSDASPVFFSPDLALILGAPSLLEDGTFQDVTGLLGFLPTATSPGGPRVEVFSDIVPVPAAAWLFGGALGLLGAVRRRAAA